MRCNIQLVNQIDWAEPWWVCQSAHVNVEVIGIFDEVEPVALEFEHVVVILAADGGRIDQVESFAFWDVNSQV